ncbi:MAG: hypothetical protein ACQKBT_03775 [Puniceicoccales bacterium]
MSIFRRLAYSILLANAVLVLGAGLGFLLGITFGIWWWALYLAGAAWGAFIPHGNSNSRRDVSGFILALALHGALLLVACGLASRFLDVGWDSLETHQRAVRLISEGWNIIDPEPGWINGQPEEGILRKAPSVYHDYLDFNAMYVVSSLMGDLPFGYEGAKGYRILLLIMVGILVADLLRRAGFRRGVSAATGFFVAANPVGLYQLWVLFMDFDVAVYSTLSIVALYALSLRGDRRAVWVALTALLLLLVSKRSGLAFAVPLGGMLFLWCIAAKMGWWRGTGSPSAASRTLHWPRFLQSRRSRFVAGGVGLMAVIACVGVFGGIGGKGQSRDGGYYSLGFIYRAVFEPDDFDRNLDLVVPESHAGLSRPVQFVRSLVEETGILRGGSPKMPLTWEPEEWETFRNIHWPGHGSGGFGPLFSGVLFLSLLAWGLTWLPFPPALSAGSVFRGGLFFLLIGICMLLPSWWARWVPFVWILPLFFLLPPFFLHPHDKPQSRLLLAGRNYWLPSLCAGLALLCAGINSVILFAISTEETLRVTQSIEAGLEAVAGQEVILDPGRNLMTKSWLIERGIDYRLSEERGALIFEMEPSTARLYQPSVSQ